ncbi:MAG: hypothetical protein JXR73_21135 [Candidatus Omnitrophica bacterium]|nr:hypothetical protein [Candidatus Omnitrophota bacterium]
MMDHTQDFLRELNRVKRRWCIQIFLKRFFLSGFGLFCALLLIVCLEHFFFYTAALRYVMGAALLFLVLFCAAAICLPWLKRLSDERAARRLEIFNLGLENRLINFLQFRRQNMHESILTQMAGDAFEALKQSPCSVGVNKKRIQQYGAALLASWLLFSAHFYFYPERTQNTLWRILLPWSNISPYFETRIHLSPGDAAVAEGDSLEVKIHCEGKRPSRLSMVTSMNRDSWIREPVDWPESGMDAIHRFEKVSRDFDYFVEADDGLSEVHRVTMLLRPVIAERSIQLLYPSYTQRPAETIYNIDAGIAVLAGTRIILCATSDIPIESGRLALEQDGRKTNIPAQVLRRRCMKAEFTVQQNGFFSIHMISEQGLENRNPIRYALTAIPDVPPTIAMPLPGRDLLSASMPSSIPCLIQARDDVGVRQIDLYCADLMRVATEVIASKPGGAGVLYVQLEHILDVTDSVYEPGRTFELFAAAQDVFGHRVKSQRYTIRIQQSDQQVDSNPLTSKELAEIADEMREALIQQKAGEDREKEKKETLLGLLDELWQKQKELIPPAQDLLEIPEEQRIQNQEDELERLALAEKRLLEDIQDFNQYLKELAPAAFDDPTMVDEFREIIDNVERAEESLIGNAVEIALDSEEAALNCIEKLEERIESELESWLPDKPDRIKWNLEDAPLEQIDEISLVDLPEELEDLIGELIEDEEDVNEQTEDLSSNWASADLEEGWDVMDGQISNFSAKGKTGNTLPDSTEATGRSGEGRTGKSNGQFVEKYAQHKDNRQTGPRMRDEPFEDAVVQELDNKPPGESTGGGKKSGMGTEGFTGKPPLSIQNKMTRLADMQKEIRDRAEKLDKQLNHLYLSPLELKKSVEAMKNIEIQLQDFQLINVIEKQRQVVQDLRTIQKAVSDPMQSYVEKISPADDSRNEPVQGMQSESVPSQYAEALQLYFRSLSENERTSNAAP